MADHNEVLMGVIADKDREIQRLEADVRRLTQMGVQAEAKLKAVVEAHGPAKRRCACPGCRKMLPACWVSVLCHACATEDCDHAAAKEKP